jgi:hypothetical protein
MNKYIVFNEGGSFSHLLSGYGGIESDTIIKITDKQYSKYEAVLCEFKSILQLKNGRVNIINRFSSPEIKEQEKARLIDQAQKLLDDSDYRATTDKMESYTPEKQAAIKEYREALREVKRQAKCGNLLDLPLFEQI